MRGAIPNSFLLLMLALIPTLACSGSKGPESRSAAAVLVLPAVLTLNPGDTQGFRATSPDKGEVKVSWSLPDGVSGNWLSVDGILTAPPNPGVYHVRGTDLANPQIHGEATVTVTSVPILTQSRLGIWLWRLDHIGVAASHAQLAAKLKAMGVKRVFAKVADGSQQNSLRIGLPWDDPALPQAYHAQGLEIWAWSYNYPGTNAYHKDQSGALLNAARNHFDGFVVDMETEFETATPALLTDFFGAFSEARDEAVRQGWVPSRAAFKLLCTTYGNVGSDLPPAQRHPLGGHFTAAQLQAADSWVDGWMPQTYLEAWNQVKAPARFISEGNRVYRACGVTKPIWHITQTEEGEAMAGDIESFFLEAAKVSPPEGLQVSLWSIPNAGQQNHLGQRVDLQIWDTQNRINWRVFDP